MLAQIAPTPLQDSRVPLGCWGGRERPAAGQISLPADAPTEPGYGRGCSEPILRRGGATNTVGTVVPLRDADPFQNIDWLC